MHAYLSCDEIYLFFFLAVNHPLSICILINRFLCPVKLLSRLALIRGNKGDGGKENTHVKDKAFYSRCLQVGKSPLYVCLLGFLLLSLKALDSVYSLRMTCI